MRVQVVNTDDKFTDIKRLKLEDFNLDNIIAVDIYGDDFKICIDCNDNTYRLLEVLTNRISRDFIGSGDTLNKLGVIRRLLEKGYKVYIDKEEYCDGLDCAWCVTFCCPKEYEYLKADNEKLKQTLAEIKEILEIHKDNKCAICPKFDECFEHPSCDNIILQKISKIENESK